jgi:hypothetical protein
MSLLYFDDTRLESRTRNVYRKLRFTIQSLHAFVKRATGHYHQFGSQNVTLQSLSALVAILSSDATNSIHNTQSPIHYPGSSMHKS